MALYFLIVFGGLVAGFIGTLAGLGAVLSFIILMDVAGLSPEVANATNRLGVMAMALMALPSFYKSGHLNNKSNKPIVLSLILGASAGFVFALYADGTTIRSFFKYLLPFFLLLVFSNPKKWLRETDRSFSLNLFLSVPFFMLLGFYAGFIQAGTGIMIIIFLTLVGRYSLIEANGVKLLAFALITSGAIIVFAYNNLIDWKIGALLALGQGIGGYIAARFATSYPQSNIYVRYLLIVALLLAIIREFGIYQ